MTTRDMVRWLKQYEQFRTNPYEKNEAWTSTKYDINGMTWREISQIYLPELEMNFGPACSALRKSWYRYARMKQQGQYADDIAFRINEIQNAMGIQETDFADEDEEEEFETDSSVW